VFGVSPDIKITSFGVRRLKNWRVTPNREEIKDEKRTFWEFFQTKHDFLCAGQRRYHRKVEEESSHIILHRQSF